jgi:hypothetical protein
VLVDLAEAGGEMPEYLAKYVSDPTVDTWPVISLRQGHELAEECVAISEELSKPDTIFSSRLLLARMTAVGGRTDAAVSHLHTMLEEATDDEQRAELHYWLWKLPLLPLFSHRDQVCVGGSCPGSALQDAVTPSNSPFRKGGEQKEQERGGHRIEALRLYHALFEKTPKHDYRKRIEELTDMIQPTTAEDDNVAA